MQNTFKLSIKKNKFLLCVDNWSVWSLNHLYIQTCYTLNLRGLFLNQLDFVSVCPQDLIIQAYIPICFFRVGPWRMSKEISQTYTSIFLKLNMAMCICQPQALAQTNTSQSVHMQATSTSSSVQHTQVKDTGKRYESSTSPCSYQLKIVFKAH